MHKIPRGYPHRKRSRAQAILLYEKISWQAVSYSFDIAYLMSTRPSTYLKKPCVWSRTPQSLMLGSQKRQLAAHISCLTIVFLRSAKFMHSKPFVYRLIQAMHREHWPACFINRENSPRR